MTARSDIGAAEYQKALDIVQIPERIIQFRVVWEDDKGQPQVNRGFRVQVRIPTQQPPPLFTQFIQ